MESSFALQENQLQFKSVHQNIVDGVTLSQEESQYLLPHFLMLLIGKPGSGKTTLLKQLLTNRQMYYQKFDEVLMISPSYAKMGIKIKEENTRSKFSLDWIFSRFEAINERQATKIYGHNFGGKKLPEDKITATGAKRTNNALLNDYNSRFQMASILTKGSALQNSRLGFINEQPKDRDKKQQEDDEGEMIFQQQQQQMFRELQELPFEQQQRSHVNVLLVLDDVVGSIKKAEYDPRLAQLVMNRRHLLFNGTISIIIVSQKYTLIPVRIRSNANWLILYQLNPIDFENIYKDVIVHDTATWRRLLEFVFGKTLQKQDGSDIQEFIKSKKFENLGIWVEFNIYFKNFKRILL